MIPLWRLDYGVLSVLRQRPLCARAIKACVRQETFSSVFDTTPGRGKGMLTCYLYTELLLDLPVFVYLCLAVKVYEVSII